MPATPFYADTRHHSMVEIKRQKASAKIRKRKSPATCRASSQDIANGLLALARLFILTALLSALTGLLRLLAGLLVRLTALLAALAATCWFCWPPWFCCCGVF